MEKHPGDSIRPADPTKTHRIRYRIVPETDLFHEKTIGSDLVFVGFLSVGIRSGLHRKRYGQILPELTIGSYLTRSEPSSGKPRKTSDSGADRVGFHRISIKDCEVGLCRKISCPITSNPIIRSYRIEPGFIGFFQKTEVGLCRKIFCPISSNPIIRSYRIDARSHYPTQILSDAVRSGLILSGIRRKQYD
jgi:hypothetical protein